VKARSIPPVYKTQRHWSMYHRNAIALEIRELFRNTLAADGLTPLQQSDRLARQGVLVTLAMTLAKRFKNDNGRSFSGDTLLEWLDQCSPDPVQYPFSELWSE
jgi:hypothetical protein